MGLVVGLQLDRWPPGDSKKRAVALWAGPQGCVVLLCYAVYRGNEMEVRTFKARALGPARSGCERLAAWQKT